jgi:hypothetical protein
MVGMDILTVAVLFVGGFAEAAAVAAVGLSLVGLDYEWGAVLRVGFLQAILLCIARALPFQAGIHSILLIVTMMLLINYLLRVRPLVALIASLTGICVLSLVETVVTPVVLNYFAVPQAMVFARPLLRLGMLGLNAAVMTIILHLVRKTGFAFIRAGLISDDI